MKSNDVIVNMVLNVVGEDLEKGGQVLHYGITLRRKFDPLSFGHEIYSTFSLVTQVYKWVPATYRW